MSFVVVLLVCLTATCCCASYILPSRVVVISATMTRRQRQQGRRFPACWVQLHQRDRSSSSSAYSLSDDIRIEGINDEINDKEHNPRSPPPPHLVFPGGGIFFYWQAGLVCYLREEGYDLSRVTATGASAGALTATLALTGVDYYEATALALKLSEEAGIWDRTGGLRGIWGPMVEEWLQHLLPENSLRMLEMPDNDNDNAGPDHRLCILATSVSGLGSKERICRFHDRNDLIRWNMASVHIPWFMDGNLFSRHRNALYIDGSFLSTDSDYLPPGGGRATTRTGSAPAANGRRQQKIIQESPLPPPQTLVFDYALDPLYRSRDLLDFVRAFSPDTIWNMLEDGKRYGNVLEERGELAFLPKVSSTDVSGHERQAINGRRKLLHQPFTSREAGS